MKPSHKQNQTKQKLYTSVRNNIRKFLKGKNIDNDTISQVCGLIVTRKSYEEKALELLDYWGISISDIGTTLKEIVNIRDFIIHRGLYFHDKNVNRAMKVIEASEDLFQILTRIFLAMLRYNGDYYYPRESKWIKFKDVC